MCLEVRLCFIARPTKERKNHLECGARVVHAPRRTVTCNEKCLAGDIRGVTAQRILERQVRSRDVPHTDVRVTPVTVENRYARQNQCTRVEAVVQPRDSSLSETVRPEECGRSGCGARTVPGGDCPFADHPSSWRPAPTARP
jgi:hypothetical protein